MGADKAIHVEVDQKTHESITPLEVSKMIKKIVQDEKIDLVFLGKQVGEIVSHFYVV